MAYKFRVIKDEFPKDPEKPFTLVVSLEKVCVFQYPPCGYYGTETEAWQDKDALIEYLKKNKLSGILDQCAT